MKVGTGVYAAVVSLPLALAALVLGACVGSTNTPEPRPDEARHAAPVPKPQTPPQPAPVQPVAAARPHTAESPAPEPEQAPTVEEDPQVPPPAFTSTAQGFVVKTAKSIEEIEVVPDGVAFVQWGEIWIASPGAGAVESVVAGRDLHGLTTDGTWLYWLGNERNGRLELATGAKEPLPRFARPGGQQDLSVGDVPYALTDGNVVWRLEGLHVSRVKTHLDRTWRVVGGALGAGNRVVVFPVFGDRKTFLWRLRVGGNGHRVETRGIFPRSWSVDARGRLVFIRGASVMRLDPKSKRAKPLFEEPNIRAVCWCGADVCTFVDDQVRLHVRGGDEHRVLAEDTGKVTRISCSARRVAWTVPGPSDSGRLGVAELRASTKKSAH